jgi:hypothetical protein
VGLGLQLLLLLPEAAPALQPLLQSAAQTEHQLAL